MAFFLTLLPSVWPWLILITGQIVALQGYRTLSTALLLLFACVTLALGLITPVGLLIGASGLVWAVYVRRLTGAKALTAHAVLVVWCLALGAHLVPGFHNLLLLDQVYAGPESRPFTLYLNLDKPLVFFAALLAWPVVHATAPLRKWPLSLGLTLLPLLLIAAVASGAVRPELGLPDWWLVFVMSNLFLTCLTEEAFFRGYLQSAFVAKAGPVIGLIAASLMFGVAHMGGGLVLMLFASLLGLACGLGYYATERLWVPTLVHFGFNFLHLTLFTYPAPA